MAFTTSAAPDGPGGIYRRTDRGLVRGVEMRWKICERVPERAGEAGKDESVSVFDERYATGIPLRRSTHTNYLEVGVFGCCTLDLFASF